MPSCGSTRAQALRHPNHSHIRNDGSSLIEVCKTATKVGIEINLPEAPLLVVVERRRQHKEPRNVHKSSQRGAGRWLDGKSPLGFIMYLEFFGSWPLICCAKLDMCLWKECASCLIAKTINGQVGKCFHQGQQGRLDELDVNIIPRYFLQL